MAVSMLHAADAKTKYVSDQFEITLRSGPDGQNEIFQMLPSGTRLKVLSGDEGGYTLVKSPEGKQGYVLTRFLAEAPNARDQLAALKKQLADLQQEPDQLTSQLLTLQQQHNQLEQQHALLLNQKQTLDAQLSSIKEASSDAIAIAEERDNLRAQSKEMSERVKQVQASNRSLRNKDDREWFLIGGGVLLGGIVLGLILPRLRRRRSAWGDL